MLFSSEVKAITDVSKSVVPFIPGSYIILNHNIKDDINYITYTIMILHILLMIMKQSKKY